MITEQQKNNIHRLSVDDCLVIMHECAERVGLANPRMYSEVTGKPIRTVYQAIKENRIKSFSIADGKFPCINER